MKRLSVLVCFGLCATASAEPFDHYEEVEVSGQNDTAQPTTMPWCEGKYSRDSWDTGRLRRQIGSGGLSNLADAAAHLCEHREDPTWIKQATYLVQAWMNRMKMVQADAEKDIARRIKVLDDERANEGKPPSDEQKNAFADHQLTPIQPDPGTDTAKITSKPAWCDKADVSDKWDAGRLSRTFKTNYLSALVEAAQHICQRTDPTWLAEAGYILQQYMNWTGLSQAEAEKALRVRIQADRWKADREKLCKDLEPGPEDAGEVKSFALARRRFFACGDDKELWLSRSARDEDVAFYLDLQGAKPESEVLRMFYLFSSVPAPTDKLPSKDASENRPLLYYAIAQKDYAALDRTAVDKELSAAPYNDYARVIAAESLAALVRERKQFDAAVDKLAKDDDYKTILRDAPAKGWAQWDALAAQWKAEIERSNAFEKKLSNPSRKVLKGCSAELHKDAEKLLKSYKTTDMNDLRTKIGDDPIGVLLLSRLAVCEAADGVIGAGTLKQLAEHGRGMRGPRTAAYYQIVDAITDALKDRPRLAVSISSFYSSSGNLIGMYDRDFDFSGGLPYDDKAGERGVVKSATKVPDGVAVVFKTEKLTWPDMDCVDDTRHPTRIDEHGEIHYAQNCKATGTYSSQDITAAPVVIPAIHAAAIKPGVYMVVGHLGGTAKNGNDFAIPYYVKKSAKDTKVLAFIGFPL